MNAHTPGPWMVSSRSGFVRTVNGEYAIASVYGHEGEPNYDAPGVYANSCLIAAAPDMLAALEALVTSLAEHDDEGMIEHARQMVDARAAIKKARGEA